MVTIYTKPGCVQCNATIRAFDKMGFTHSVVDVSEDTAASHFVRGLGYAQAPVVVYNDSIHWSGFRPDRIKRLQEELERQPVI